MEFWGVEVKAGQPLKVKPAADKLIHLSQASLGDSKTKGNESVPLYLKFDDQKLVLGTLSQEKFPQVAFDLVFEKEFELSHNWKNGSVYFCGYRADSHEGDDHDEFDTDSEEELEEHLLLNNTENGKANSTITTNSTAKPETSEKQVTLVEPSKVDKDDDSSDEDMDNDSDDDEDDDDDDSDELGDDSDDDSDEDSEETPKKPEQVKKRPAESATKTPVPAKKAKQMTPQKTDGKKNVHTATPHPSKNAGKTPANSEQSKTQTPKSGGQFSCKSCSKAFGTEIGLQSHTKAKHSGN